MKKKFCVVVVLCLILLRTAASVAADKTSVAVLPFAVHSAEPLDYVRQGIWDMLTSRLSADDRISVFSRDSILDALKGAAGKDLSQADVYGLGKTLKADFVVWGSITKIGNSLSIDGKLVDIAAYKSPVGIFVQSQNMDEVIPRISDFSQRITNHLTGAPPAESPPPVAPLATSSRPPTSGDSREAAIIADMRTGKRGTFTSAMNPDFINAAQPLDRKGFWMSETFSTEFKGMDIGDVDGDGLNEVVMIDAVNIYIYRKTKTAFTLVQKIDGKRFDNYLSLDVADINRNGISEIIVTNLRQAVFCSFVIEYRDGRFQKIADNLPWMLRVIGPPSLPPRLIGQRFALEVPTSILNNPFDTPIHQIVWENGTYIEGQRMRIPQGLSVYGLTLDALGSGTDEKVIAIDQDDYLCIYEPTTKPLIKLDVFGGSKEKLFKSDSAFGGSNSTLDLSAIQSQTGSDNVKVTFYLNPRILTYDTNKDKTRELILIKNISSSGRILKNIKLFTASEVYDLEWDGLGLVENWKTRKINGYVADYQFKDIDNDGENEIVLALVQSVGLSIGQRSVIVAYKMAPQTARE